MNLNSSAEILLSFKATEMWSLILLSISSAKTPSFSCFLAFALNFLLTYLLSIISTLAPKVTVSVVIAAGAAIIEAKRQIPTTLSPAIEAARM